MMYLTLGSKGMREGMENKQSLMNGWMCKWRNKQEQNREKKTKSERRSNIAIYAVKARIDIWRDLIETLNIGDMKIDFRENWGSGIESILIDWVRENLLTEWF